jgi:hypothetical protein
MADVADLEAAAKVLLDRADDLYYVGQQIVRHSVGVRWECAKADRFRDAMLARQAECRRLAIDLRDLGRALRVRAQLASAQQGA